jgi:tripartite-type tricarboxylate transporter receptor subunit TctC
MHIGSVGSFPRFLRACTSAQGVPAHVPGLRAPRAPGALRGLAACLACLPVLLLPLRAASADAYPNRSIRLVVPFVPGGVTDTSARALVDKLSQRLGQQVVVENRPGSNGNIGTEIVARAAPDGYTLLLGFDGTLVINPHVYSRVPFDPVRDFAPVTKLGDAAMILVTYPGVPATDFRSLVALSHAKPGTLSYGTSGTGSTPHLAGELLKLRSGIDMVHIPYKGGGQAMSDLVGGQLPVVFTAIATAQQYVKNGRAHAIAIASAKRSGALPDVPTLIESGVEGFEMYSWVGILAPAGTPEPIIDRLHREVVASMQDPAVRARYAVLGIDPVANTPEAFARQIREDLDRSAVVVQKAGIHLSE